MKNVVGWGSKQVGHGKLPDKKMLKVMEKLYGLRERVNHALANSIMRIVDSSYYVHTMKI
jgi:hypothetical protein